ncbi:DNRLRE domain-containing protein [Streptomyces sp. NPDC127172]|uniref:golvesin C-terminal-like domain-containing protein n=1 Tax=Streptomyces sp. NPDC127172 TaxID=3345382 RepID=UPI003628C950
MVDSSVPDKNYNGIGTAKTGNWQLGVGTTATGKRRSLVQFPLDGIPAGVKIDSARLGLYFDQAHTTGDQDVTVEAHRATGSWEQTAATWNNTSSLSGELSGTTVQVDDGDAGTAAVGEWPRVGTIGSVNGGNDYTYNKNSLTGESYTWQPKVPEEASYKVEAHYAPLSDATTAAPYTVTYDNNGTPVTSNYTVNQSSGSTPVWKQLGTSQLSFAKGTTGKVVLGDTGDASHRTVADAIRLVNPGQIVKNAGEYNQWHNFPVTDTVQKWVSGTATNYGFVLQASDEATLGQGGPLYEGSEYGYGGETATYPKLTVTFDTVGTKLNAPSVLHDTGAELSWSAYGNGDPDTTGDDIVEYQIHRSVFQGFTPDASTLVAPVTTGSTSYTDTSAPITQPDANGGGLGRAYYYQIAVKTKDGSLLGSPVQLVRLPLAGRTTEIIQTQSGITDTTLSSTESTTAHDTITDTAVAQPWLSVGNNHPTLGKTRALLDFPVSTNIPASATVISSNLDLWGTTTNPNGNGATYQLRTLTRDFDEAATWTKASAAGNWTTAGGDMGAAQASTVSNATNDPKRYRWDATSLTQSWIKTPSGNKGMAIRLADESTTGPQERTTFLSSEAPEKQLRPQLQVTYVDSTTPSTYSAQQTPARMTPNSTYTVAVTVTNTTSTSWTPTSHELSYRWSLPDGTDKTDGGNQVATALPATLLPGQSRTVQAQVKTPINSAEGSKRSNFVLTWDIRNKSTGQWQSAGTPAIAGLAQNIAVEDPTSNTLGLEKFYTYTGKNTGAGSTLMNNLASGNSVWSYNAFTNPGRGLTTFARFAYNSLDTSDTVSGPGWSAQLAGPIRLGAALDFHPNPVQNATEIRLPDGDGTTHTFTKQADGSWKAPAGVHYKVTMKAGLDCTPNKDPIPDAWTLTRPDGTRFLFGCDGYLTSATDKNGNTQTYTYEERKSNSKPTKFLKYITDPAGRQTLSVDYYDKDNAVSVKSVDHVKSMSDINSGRTLTFEYSTEGLLTKLTDGAGSSQPKVFRFTYDALQGTKNVKLTDISDPRQHSTKLEYYQPPTGDSKYHWWTKTITDRLQGKTDFTYATDTVNTKFINTTVTDAESHVTQYQTDDFARPIVTTNAKSQTTRMSWDADNNVTYLEEANAAKTAYCYDQKTGYPLWQRDAENNKTGVPPASDCTFNASGKLNSYPANSAQYTYQTRLDGFSADLFTKTSPEGHKWQFGYDTFGNLKTLTDPKGVATTSVPDDYTTKYDYDAYGEMTKATDANGNPTTYSGFGPTGYPTTITDALNKSTDVIYDERGQVNQVTDALGKKTTQTYDTFGRPLDSTTPKSAGVSLTTPAPEYDANDNVTKAIAANGAVSTALYDSADQVASATAPANNSAAARATSYAYDKVGNLKTTTEPKGTATTSDTTDFVTTNDYDEIYQITSVVNADQDKVSYVYDNVGNVTTVIDPKKNATADTTDYTAKTDYDLDHRPVQVTDAAGKFTKQSYDKDGLTATTTDKETNTTTITYDERGKQVEVKAPYDGTKTRSTKYEYDQVGNVTKVITPRGTATTTSTDDFASRTTYDELNRPKRQYQPYDPADARYNKADVYTETTYDAVGRVSKTSLPPSNGEAVRNDTTYEYYDNGWAKESTDPWSIVTDYDYTDVGQQKARTISAADGSSNRTMTWDYYPDGSLKSKADNGVPVGQSVVLVDNSDTQNTSSTGTWTKADIAGQQGYNHQTHAASSGTDAFTWTLNIPKDGSYTAYVKYPKVTGAATGAKYTLTHGTTTEPSVTKDQNANTGTWVSLGTYTLKQGEDAKLKLDQNATGTAVADGVKLVRSTSGDTDNEKKNFAYAYDLNGNLTSIDDTSSGAKIDAYTVAYTGLNQVQKVTEALAGQEKKATSYAYDANGQPDTVTHPDQYSKYTYDLRELAKTVSVGKTPTDASPKVTSYTYTSRGQKLQETKGNSNTVDYTYYPDAALKTSTEKKPNGTLVTSHTYAYDPNGNKAQDVAKKMNADDHAALLSSTTDYSYDPADRLAKSVKTGTGAGTETYVHDDNANVISQTVKNVTTNYDYDRNRLQSATVVGGSTANYNYDPFGRMESTTSGSKVIERSVYDGFDHVAESQMADDTGTLKSTKYTFDPLDRTASKTADGKTTDYDYLGMSGEVLDERVGTELTKSYQYSPWGERLSQVKHNTDGTTDDGYYGYNSHSDVETLTDKNGDSKATYGYTAYGNNDGSEFTGIDKPDAADPTKEEYNPYRFNAKRWDAKSGTYDMGFRDYNPGLNRFTTRDMYNGALADMDLGSDPYSSNRYAFTGGNPTSRIEDDGHRLACGGEGSDIPCPKNGAIDSSGRTGSGGALWTDREQMRTGLGEDPVVKLTHHLTDRYGSEIRSSVGYDVIARYLPPAPADPMDGCGMADGQYVCGSAEDVQQSQQDAAVNSKTYSVISWLSFRSWANSGTALVGGDSIAAKDYFMGGCDPRAGNGCVGLAKSGAEYGLDKAGQQGAKATMGKAFGKVLGTPLGIGATVADFMINPPSDEEIQNLTFWENWGDSDNDWRRLGDRGFWLGR